MFAVLMSWEDKMWPEKASLVHLEWLGKYLQVTGVQNDPFLPFPKRIGKKIRADAEQQARKIKVCGGVWCLLSFLQQLLVLQDILYPSVTLGLLVLLIRRYFWAELPLSVYRGFQKFVYLCKLKMSLLSWNAVAFLEACTSHWILYETLR